MSMVGPDVQNPPTYHSAADNCDNEKVGPGAARGPIRWVDQKILYCRDCMTYHWYIRGNP
jgi:hypothetical protein